MAKNLPDDPDNSKSPNDKSSQGNQTLNINDFHYHGNDLAEIARIAEKSPVLAAKILDYSNQADKRKNTSYRFGLVSTTLLLSIALFTVTYIVVNQGIFISIGAAALILAIALLIRVILTGEWSDTSWFGKFIGLLAKALGSNSEDD